MSDKTTRNENRIVSEILKTCDAAGHLVSVCDGEEFTVKRSRNWKAIKAALRTTDHDFLLIRKSNGDYIGQIMLIWNNGDDGLSVVADHSDNPCINAIVDGALKNVQRRIDGLQEPDE